MNKNERISDIILTAFQIGYMEGSKKDASYTKSLSKVIDLIRSVKK